PVARSRSTARLLLVFRPDDTATAECFTLSLHAALPIYGRGAGLDLVGLGANLADVLADRQPPQHLDEPRSEPQRQQQRGQHRAGERKSTRLNSSHVKTSYAVFCLKQKNSYR